MQRLALFSLTFLLLGVCGCTHVISPEALKRVDRSLDFAAVKADPQAYLDRTLLLGGLIVDASPGRESSTVEILRYTVDRWGEPRRPDEAGGRFLAVADRFLDPELYKPGRLVTLTGTVSGKEERDLSGVAYDYPLFRIGEIYLWPQPDVYDYRYRGTLYYAPYYDPWWPYSPYWYSPYWWYPPEHHPRREHPIGKER